MPSAAAGDGSSSSQEDGFWGEKFKVYLFIECCLWMPSCYLVCYRYQPTVRLMQTPLGKAFVTRASALLQRHAPKQHASLEWLVGRMRGTPAVRAGAEWALVNKVLAPVNFPLKLYIAHKYVQWRGGGLETSASAAAAEGAPPTAARGSSETCPERRTGT